MDIRYLTFYSKNFIDIEYRRKLSFFILYNHKTSRRHSAMRFPQIYVVALLIYAVTRDF